MHTYIHTYTRTYIHTYTRCFRGVASKTSSEPRCQVM